MKITPLEPSGVLLIESNLHHDSRGSFREAWNASRYEDAGISRHFVQDNVSFSTRSVIRGLHLQHPEGQAKLVSVLRGSVFDVAVDVRLGSPTFGQWVGEVLSGENARQLYIPTGFAHGFSVLSEEGAVLLYKCSEYYVRDAELTIRWDDPDLGIEWRVGDPILSEKDRAGSLLREVPNERLPSYVAGAPSREEERILAERISGHSGPAEPSGSAA